MIDAGPPPAAAPVGRSNHVCVVHTDGKQLLAAAQAFLQEGRKRNERLVFLGSGSIESLHRQLGALAGLRELLDTDRLTVGALDGHYGADEVPDPQATMAAYDAATRAALAAGYRGLRVVAEATALVRTPEQRAAFARYEHLVDRYMVDHPFTAMCAYDGAELGDAVTEIACLHPVANAGAAPFHWYAGVAVDVHLTGEVDVVAHDTLAAVAELTLPLHGEQVVVDATALEFIDHRGLLTLDEHARRSDTTIKLVSDRQLVRRLADHLELRALEVVPS
jgi:anti-anti-sigma regulatory factor